MKVGELCNKTVVTASQNQSLKEAAHSMRENHVGNLVIVEEGAVGDTKPIGIITDRDLALAMAEIEADQLPRTDIGNCMSEVLIVARKQEPLEDVLQNMTDNGVRRVPVVDTDGELYGILSFDDIVGYFGDQIMKLGELVQEEITREVTGEP